MQLGRGEPGGLGRADSAAGAGRGEEHEPEGRPAVPGKVCCVLGSKRGRRLRSQEKVTGSCKGAWEHPAVPAGVPPPHLPTPQGCRQQPQALRDVASPLSKWGKGPLMARGTFICFYCCRIRA